MNKNLLILSLEVSCVLLIDRDNSVTVAASENNKEVFLSKGSIILEYGSHVNSNPCEKLFSSIKPLRIESPYT